MLYPPFKKLRSSVHPSVCSSVCLSVRPSTHRFYSLLGAFLTDFLELILGGSVLGLQMSKFWQISTDLRPLINVRIGFHSLSLAFLYRFFFKLGMRVDIVKECSWIADG